MRRIQAASERGKQLTGRQDTGNLRLSRPCQPCRVGRSRPWRQAIGWTGGGNLIAIVNYAYRQRPDIPCAPSVSTLSWLEAVTRLLHPDQRSSCRGFRPRDGPRSPRRPWPNSTSFDLSSFDEHSPYATRIRLKPASSSNCSLGADEYRSIASRQPTLQRLGIKIFPTSHGLSAPSTASSITPAFLR